MIESDWHQSFRVLQIRFSSFEHEMVMMDGVPKCMYSYEQPKKRNFIPGRLVVNEDLSEMYTGCGTLRGTPLRFKNRSYRSSIIIFIPASSCVGCSCGCVWCICSGFYTRPGWLLVITPASTKRHSSYAPAR